MNHFYLADAAATTPWGVAATLIPGICAVISAILSVVAKWPSKPASGQSAKKSWRGLLPHVFYALSLIFLVSYMLALFSHVPRSGYVTFTCDALPPGGTEGVVRVLTGFVETGSDAPAVIGVTNLPVPGTTVRILASYGDTYQGKKGVKLRCHFNDLLPTATGPLVDFVIIQENLNAVGERRILSKGIGIPVDAYTPNRQ